MSTPPSRSVKISDDERGGWSSDRPRRDGGPERPANVGVRCRVLPATDRQRYAPGSLLMIVSASPADRTRFAERLIDDKSALLSLGKVRGMLEGRVPAGEIDARAAQILDAAVAKRLGARETVVIVAEGLSAEEREHYVRLAHTAERPRHLILVEASRADVPEEDRAAVNELRSVLDAGELGAEGFNTALRLGGHSVTELKRIIFRLPPRDDD